MTASPSRPRSPSIQAADGRRLRFGPRSGGFLCALVLSLVAATPASAADKGGAYIVVTPKRLAKAAAGFMKYRAGQGLDGHSIVVEEAAPGVTGVARARRLREAVRTTWRKAGAPKRTFVLLLGDTEGAGTTEGRVPHFRVKDPTEWAEKDDPVIATDYPYSLCDDEDPLADFAVGRLPVRTEAEAFAALERIRGYESGPAPGPWQRRLTFFASQGGFGPVDVLLEQMFTQMADRLIPYEFDLNMTYGNPRSPYVFPPDQFSDKVLGRINEGALLLCYIGHGHDRRLDTLRWNGRRYRILDFKALERVNVGRRAPIFLLVACYTGRFDRKDDQDSIAEKLIKSDRGPVAILASSRVSHPYPNALLQMFALRSLCRQRVATVGEMLRDARRSLWTDQGKERRRMEMMAAMMVRKPIREAMQTTHAAMYNLFGDPALRPAYARSLGISAKRSGEELVIRLEGSAPESLNVTLECERSCIPAELEEVPKDILPPAGRRIVASNYAKANNKVLAGWKVKVVDGVARVPLPARGLPKSRLFVKVFGLVRGRAASGSTEVTELLKGDAPAAEPKPETRPDSKPKPEETPSRKRRKRFFDLLPR